MLQRNQNGHNAVEYFLIVALVFLSSTLLLNEFSDSILNFWGNNAVQLTAKTSPVSNIEMFSIYADQEELNDQSISYTDDSVVLDIEGQVLEYSIDFVDSVNEFAAPSDLGSFAQTTGSSGMELVVEEISELIRKNKVNYPDSDVPVSIYMGTGQRNYNNFTNYSGTADANMVVLNADNDLVIIQNDQSCHSSVKLNTCNYGGVYTIKGTLNNGVFEADIDGKLFEEDINLVKGSFQAEVDTSNGLEFYNGLASIGYDNAIFNKFEYTWDFEFTEVY